MRYTPALALVTAVALCAGCASLRSRIPLPEPVENPSFSFVVESDPPGAEVFRIVDGKEVLLGQAPLTFPLTLTRKEGGRLLQRLGPTAWSPRVLPNLPLGFLQTRTNITVTIPEVQLRKAGYEPQKFSCQWRFPADLQQRDVKGRKIPLSAKQVAVAVLQQPAAPQYTLSLTLDCANGSANVHAVDEQGRVGRLIGATPLKRELGFAQVRSAKGELVNWLRWFDNSEADVWTHAQDGTLYFTGYLVRDGYEPERVLNRPVARIRDEPQQTATAFFQVTRPNKPEAAFKLQLDSLPTGATVYAVRPDGSLGQKVGQTPLELSVGLAQESFEDPPGRYLHKGWRIWSPMDILRWDNAPNGVTTIRLACALYREGFAVEPLGQAVCRLEPGRPFPEGATITVPLLSPEQAAAREARRPAPDLEPRRPDEEWIRRNAPAAQRPPSFVWQAPPDSAPQAQEAAKDAEQAGKKSDQAVPRGAKAKGEVDRPWWKFWKRNPAVPAEAPTEE